MIEIKFSEDSLLESFRYDLRSAIAERIGQTIEAAVDEAIGAAITERLKALTDEALRAAFDKALSEGWQPTDQYGQPRGARRTLSSWVLEYLTRKDSYNSRTPVDDAFKEHMNEALKGELRPALDDAQKKLRAMVDEEIAGKLRESVAAAFKSR